MLFSVVDYCDSLGPIIGILKAVVSLIQFGVPIILIVMGMIDLGKAVLSSKEDEMKKAQSTLLKRFIYAVAVFLIVTLVTLVMNIVSNNADKSANTWIDCWNKTKAK